MIDIEPHPLLEVGAFVSTLPRSLTEMTVVPWLPAMLSLDAEAPVHSDDAIRAAVRNVLRHGGFKPTGRSKPACEYLLRAAAGGTLGSINLVVDACNVVSLHSGLPVSVIDLDRASPPLRVAVAKPGDSYVFNASGQVIELQGLVCLFDQQGPCANAVKDAQRTKTQDSTLRTLSIVWGARTLSDQLARTVAWYRQLLERAGVKTELL